MTEKMKAVSGLGGIRITASAIASKSLQLKALCSLALEHPGIASYQGVDLFSVFRLLVEQSNAICDLAESLDCQADELKQEKKRGTA